MNYYADFIHLFTKFAFCYVNVVGVSFRLINLIVEGYVRKILPLENWESLISKQNHFNAAIFLFFLLSYFIFFYLYIYLFIF